MIIVANSGAGAVSAPAATWSFVGSSSADGTSVSYPSGTQVGDLLIYLDGASNQTSSYVGPGLWNEIAVSSVQISSTNYVAASYWLIATSTSGSVSPDYTQNTGTGLRRKMLMAFRPSFAISNVALLDVESVMSSTANPANQTISASASPAPVLCLAHGRRFGSAASTWPANMRTVLGSNAGHQAGYVIQNDTSANIDVEGPGWSNNYAGLQTFYLMGF